MDLLMMHALNAERAIDLQRAQRRRDHGGVITGTAGTRRLVRMLACRLRGLRRYCRRAPVWSDPARPSERGGIAMMTCALCKFDTPLDDVVLAGPAGRCVCLRCYSRETGTTRRMSGALEQRLRGVLEHV